MFPNSGTTSNWLGNSEQINYLSCLVGEGSGKQGNMEREKGRRERISKGYFISSTIQFQKDKIFSFQDYFRSEINLNCLAYLYASSVFVIFSNVKSISLKKLHTLGHFHLQSLILSRPKGYTKLKAKILYRIISGIINR